MADPVKNDAVGQRGEAIFFVVLTRLFGRAKPIFKPQFLGDKWPTVDFIVELLDSTSGLTPYFFVQVKATTRGTTKTKEKRLKIQVTAEDAKRLASFPAPTYVVGIDELNETAYIASANEAHTTGLSSISTEHEINKDTQDGLYTEVDSFWKTHGKGAIVSKFVDNKWR